MRGGVRRDVGDPETLRFRGDFEAHTGFGRVVLERLDVGPGFVVVADDGGSVSGDGAAIGFVVVFAGEADEIDGDGLVRGGIDLEVIPVGLAIAIVLIGFAGEMGAEMGFGDLFDAAEGAAVEVPGDLVFGEE